MAINPVKKIYIRALIFNEAPIAILLEYFDYNNVFSAKYIVELSKYTKINNHTIKLKKRKQPLFGPIYSLGLVNLKTFKIYIKINLANRFIRPSKSPIETFIFFD